MFVIGTNNCLKLFVVWEKVERVTLLEKCGLYFLKGGAWLPIEGRDSFKGKGRAVRGQGVSRARAPRLFSAPTTEFSLGDLTQGNLALV